MYMENVTKVKAYITKGERDMMKRRIRRGFCAVLAMAMLLEGNVSVTLAEAGIVQFTGNLC